MGYKHLFFRPIISSRCLVIVFCIALFLWQRVSYAISTEDTSEQTNILKVGDNMYTEARKWEIWDVETYDNQENAFTDFSKRLDAMIESDRILREMFKKYCNWTEKNPRWDCSYYIDEKINDNKELKKYFKTTPATDISLLPISFIIQNGCNDGPCLHEEIKDALTKTTYPDLMSNLQAWAITVIESIKKQMKEQTVTFKDIGWMGMYYDGHKDEENENDYDLMIDFQKIDEAFFRKTPEFWKYENTSQKEQKELVKKKNESEWGSSNNYGNLESEYQEGLWLGGSNDSASDSMISNSSQDAVSDYLSNTKSSDGKNYTITVKRRKNTDYITKETEGKESYEWLFEDGLSWIIQYGDNRNLACQVSPTINFLESVFDQVDLREVFAGSTIFPSLVAYNYYTGFHDRRVLAEKKDDKRSSSKSTETQSWDGNAGDSKNSIEDYQKEIVTSALESAFRRYSLDFEKPTNLKGSDLQWLLYYALVNSTNYAMISDTNESLVLATWANEYLTYFHGRWAERGNVNFYVNQSVEHLEYINEEMEIRIRTFARVIERIWQILDYILDKNECQSWWGTTEKK